MNKMDLIHDDRGALGIIFLSNSKLIGMDTQEVIEGLSDREVEMVCEALAEYLQSLPAETLRAFDAYPYEEVLDSFSCDPARAQDLGISTEEFRKSWNKVLFGLRGTLFGALPYLLH